MMYLQECEKGVVGKMCDKCVHKAVCGKYQATGGHVRECEHFVPNCRHCENWDKAVVAKKGYLSCQVSGMEIMARDVCSKGERRTDNAE